VGVLGGVAWHGEAWRGSMAAAKKPRKPLILKAFYAFAMLAIR